ncbi:MAG TPA: phospholipase D family protein [Gammaproteobacteria bacterium]
MIRQRFVPAEARVAPAVVFAAVAAMALVLSACGSLPSPDRSRSAPAVSRTEPAADGTLARFARRIEADLGERESAFWLLDDNADSLRIRIALADLAAETLDIQYFIWQDDVTGRLLMQHVVAAADRGVRVRFLIDDLAVGGRDDELAALDAHPRIEVRVFNPWRVRSPLGRPLEFVARIDRLNHRMHNKVFVADGRFGIIGGRNIGDRYFGVYDRFVQNDIDLLIAGPLLADLLETFDAYWQSPLARSFPGRGVAPADAWLPTESGASVAGRDERLSAFATPAGGWASWVDAFLDEPMRGEGEVLVDAPDIDRQRPAHLYERFKSFIAQAQHELVLSSPYLVPDRTFVALLEDAVERGVRVRILTNSLASNSHVVAHSAYKKWRRALLRTGVELYEMRPDAAVLASYRTPPAEPERLALHTKAAVVDRRFSFVGSPNIDPRSMVWNTEIGVIADDPALAAALIRILERDMRPENSWRVTLEDGGWLKWWNGDESLGRQPANGFSQRAVEFFLNLLPIKSQT